MWTVVTIFFIAYAFVCGVVMGIWLIAEAEASATVSDVDEYV